MFPQKQRREQARRERQRQRKEERQQEKEEKSGLFTHEQVLCINTPLEDSADIDILT